ncbi:protein of unknown function [Hyphomicrobium sp. 1Nfss2.1]|uniref:hypothetical protein n=1 Tax=Hyphomicrobium sp. 1Nfss2.1 TaxID=3413936 RepID=UPI003C7D9F22
MTADELAVHTIAYAIGTTSLRPRSRIAADNDAAKLAAARAILEHLKLSGFTVTPGPGAALHSTSGQT